MNSKLGMSIEDFQERFEASSEGKSKIAKLAKERDEISHALNSVVLERKGNKFELPIKENQFRIAIISDLHIGSLYENLSVIEACYKRCISEGISDILMPGDIFDGHKIYAGQEFELHKRGWDEQREWGLKVIPYSPKIKVHFITGNHDHSFKKCAGISVGKEWAKLRPDWNFVGEDYGDVTFTTRSGRKFVISMLHPDGGSAYTLSYKPQRIVEQLEGGTKPNIMLIGHFHKAEFIPSYRNVAVLQAGTGQRQTPFMKRKPSAAHVGFWNLEVTIGKMTNSIKAEFSAFY